MDLRERKTKRSIKNAFLQLRAQKPLERITVKELAGLAEISKATFYLHYKDIYDLSGQLQNEVIQTILDDVLQPEVPLLDMVKLTRALFESFLTHQDQINTLFSGSQATVLPYSIEQGIKEHIFRTTPDAREDMALNVFLSYQIYGSYYAYSLNSRRFGRERVLDIIDGIAAQLQDIPIGG